VKPQFVIIVLLVSSGSYFTLSPHCKALLFYLIISPVPTCLVHNCKTSRRLVISICCHLCFEINSLWSPSPLHTPHRCLPRYPISDFQQISLLEVPLRMEANVDGLAWPERRHTSAAGGVIHRRVMIRSELSSLMANYSKIKTAEPQRSCIAMAVEENWNPEEWEGIEEIERRTEKLRREAAERLDKDNVLESKIARDCCLCLQPGKRLKTRL